VRVLPGRERVSVSAGLGSGTELSRVPGSFKETFRMLEGFPKPRSSSSSSSLCVARAEERGVMLESETEGIGETSINDTKSDDGDKRSFSNSGTVGVVVLEFPVLEEPHHAPALESPSEDC
jgi:hypothetical protein